MTQHQKILYIMSRNPKKWHYPHDFMRPGLGDLFVGYKAPSRLSELERKYPGIFIKEQEKGFVKRRLNVEEFDNWFYNLPDDLANCVKQPRRLFGYTF